MVAWGIESIRTATVALAIATAHPSLERRSMSDRQRNLTVSVPRTRVRTRRASSRLSTRPPNAFQKSRCLLELYLAVPIALNGVRVGAFLLCFNAFLVVGAPLLAVPAQHLWLAVRSERGHCMCRRRRRALSSHEAADGPAVVVAPSCEPAVAASSRRLESGRRRWRPLLRRASVLAPCAGRGVAAEFGPGVGGGISRSFEAAPRVLSRGGSSRAVAHAPARARGHTPPPLPLSSRWAFGLSRETGAAPSSSRRRALVSRVAYGAFPSLTRSLVVVSRALSRCSPRACASFRLSPGRRPCELRRGRARHALLGAAGGAARGVPGAQGVAARAAERPPRDARRATRRLRPGLLRARPRRAPRRRPRRLGASACGGRGRRRCEAASLSETKSRAPLSCRRPFVAPASLSLSRRRRRPTPSSVIGDDGSRPFPRAPFPAVVASPARKRAGNDASAVCALGRLFPRSTCPPPLQIRRTFGKTTDASPRSAPVRRPFFCADAMPVSRPRRRRCIDDGRCCSAAARSARCFSGCSAGLTRCHTRSP